MRKTQRKRFEANFFFLRLRVQSPSSLSLACLSGAIASVGLFPFVFLAALMQSVWRVLPRGDSRASRSSTVIQRTPHAISIHEPPALLLFLSKRDFTFFTLPFL